MLKTTLQKCLEQNIVIDPRPTIVFVRCGMFEVSERYDQYEGGREAALDEAVKRLEDLVSKPIEPKLFSQGVLSTPRTRIRSPEDKEFAQTFYDFKARVYES